jgi:hypothetical protein
MLTDKQIEELSTCDYDGFVDSLLKEIASLSIDKNLLDDIIDVSSEPLRSDFLVAISKIRDEKIEDILKNKNEER